MDEKDLDFISDKHKNLNLREQALINVLEVLDKDRVSSNEEFKKQISKELRTLFHQQEKVIESLIKGNNIVSTNLPTENKNTSISATPSVDLNGEVLPQSEFKDLGVNISIVKLCKLIQDLFFYKQTKTLQRDVLKIINSLSDELKLQDVHIFGADKYASVVDTKKYFIINDRKEIPFYIFKREEDNFIPGVKRDHYFKELKKGFYLIDNGKVIIIQACVVEEYKVERSSRTI